MFVKRSDRQKWGLWTGQLSLSALCAPTSLLTDTCFKPTTLSVAVLSVSTHWPECSPLNTPVNITHTAAIFISLSDKCAAGKPRAVDNKEECCYLETIFPCLIIVICEPIRSMVLSFYPCYCDCTLVVTSCNHKYFPSAAKISLKQCFVEQ